MQHKLYPPNTYSAIRKGIRFTLLVPGLLACLMILLPACRQVYTDSDIIVTPQDRQLLDSMKQAAQKAVPDTALAIYGRIREIAQERRYTTELFHACCKTAVIIAGLKDDFKAAKALLDSTAILAADDPSLKACLEIRYGLIYGQTDSAIYYFTRAMERPELLTNEDQLLASGSISILFTTAKNYNMARQYALQFLQANRRSHSLSRVKDEVVMLNNLYLIETGLGDSMSAGRYLRQAARLAEDSLGNAGYLVVYQNMGKYYLLQQKPDSALLYFRKFGSIIERDFQYQPAYHFYPLLYFAEAALAGKDYRLSRRHLDQAAVYLAGDTSLLHSDQTILKEYYETLYQVSKAQGQTTAALEAFEKRYQYNDSLLGQEKSEQLLSYEKKIRQAAADKAIGERQQKLERQRIITASLAGLCILLLILAVLAVQYWRKKKQLESQRLRELEQKSELERTSLLLQTESKERRRIARELHDELGSTLTSIGLAVEVLKQQQAGSQIAAQPLEILARNSRKLTSQTNEIVWSLNDGNDNLQNLVAYIRKHCTVFLKEAGIALVYREEEEIPSLALEGFKRRYIFHSVKEIVHNAVKYSGAATIKVMIGYKPGMLRITVADNGKGLPPEADIAYGNGIRNVQEHMAALAGTVRWLNREGTTVQLDIPL